MIDGAEIVTAELSIDLPPLDLIERVAQPLSAANALVALQRAALSQAQDLLIHTASMGLGDCLCELRFALMAARCFPNKRVSILVHPAIVPIPWVDLPPNARLLTGLPEGSVERPTNVFFLTYNYGLDMAHVWLAWKNRFNLPWDPGPMAALMRALRQKGAAVDTAELRTALADYLRSTLVEDEAHRSIQAYPTYNAWDLLCAVRNWTLGIPISRADFQRSVFTDGPFRQPPADQPIDLLVAPDAFGAELDHSGRSYKSLLPPTWSRVLHALPVDLSVGILIGTAHAAYCDEVFHLSQRVYPGLQRIVTPTLSDWCLRVASSRCYIGSDTGTTHLAADLAAADPRESPLTIGALFNREVADLALHGIRALGSRGKILVYQRQRHSMRPIPHRHWDIAALPPEAITEFILQGLNRQ